MKNRILIYDTVGSDRVDGEILARQIMSMDEDSSVDTIEIQINSAGGSMINGYSIVSAITDAKTKTLAKINGVAASMASVIAVACDEVVAKDYALMMIHNANLGGSEPDEKQRAVLEKFSGSMAGLYARRSTLEPERVMALMENETWMDADEMLAYGFADRIEETAEKTNLKKLITAGTDVSAIVAHANKINQKSNENMKEIKAAFGLPVDADQSEIIAQYQAKLNRLESISAKVEDIEAKLKLKTDEVEAKESELVEVKAKLKEFETREAEAVEARAEALVEQALKEGRIDAESKEDWLASAKENFDRTMKLISKIEKPVALSKAVGADKEDENRKNDSDEFEFKASPIQAMMMDIQAKLSAE